MRIIKKINNNVALARDAKGNELIVFGKGIGFPATPYELEDLSLIQRTFYDVYPQYMDLIKKLPQEMIFLAADIAENAQDELGCELRMQNMVFSLADHLNYAVQRTLAGVVLDTPLDFDVRSLYPHEYQLGEQALHLIRKRTGVLLPSTEAANIALHITNAENDTADMHATLETTQIISDITAIVEDFFSIHLDRSSFYYARFTMHLRYLVQRMMKKEPLEPLDNGRMFHSLRREYPELYACACKITDYLENTWSWSCTCDEQLFLMMHLNRVARMR